jgi:hypothetical protein
MQYKFLRGFGGLGGGGGSFLATAATSCHHTRRQSNNFSWGWIGASSSIHTGSLNWNSIRGFWIQTGNCVVSQSSVNVSDVSETAEKWKEGIGVCFEVSYGEALNEVASSALSLVPFKSNAVLFNFKCRRTAWCWWSGWNKCSFSIILSQ